MAILKVRYEGNVYEVHTCFDERKCTSIASKYTDGIIDIAEMLESPKTSDEELITDPQDKRTAAQLREWLVGQAKRLAALGA